MNSKPRTLILESMYHQAGLDLLAQFTDLVILEGATETRIISAIKDVSAVFVRYPSRLSGTAIKSSENVIVISTSGRGTDSIDLEAASAAGIAVVNNPGAGRIPVSEHTMALLLELAKQVRRSDQEIRAGGGFGQGAISTRFHLQGRSIGIIGCGDIGAEVARKCSVGFGMDVFVYDPFVCELPSTIGSAKQVDSLDEILPLVDFISIHAELNELSARMVDRSFLKAMREDAYFINTARGGIVCQSDLVEALKKKWIAGAALDVFEDEPIPLESPLNRLDNLIMTAHTAGLTVEARKELSISAASQILQALRGERPMHLVNSDIWRPTSPLI